MGDLVDSVLDIADPGGITGGLSGQTSADASLAAAELQADSAERAIQEQREAAERAQTFFEPFAGAAERGIEESGFLADPQAQFDFLQSNPLFKASLENANRSTQQQAASRGRSSFGTTQQDLTNNVLLSASPLVDRQRQDVNNLINLGSGIATSQANIETGKAAGVSGLITDQGAANAAGQVGAANATTQGSQNLLSTGLAAAAFFSDERLKTNKQIIGELNNHPWYSWDWNEIAGELLGLFGSSEGVMAQEVIKTNPDAVMVDDSGFYKVNYGAL